MSGLDPVGRALVKDIILDLKAKGKCVFFSTHITADVETVCDRVGIIVQGTLQRVEQVDSILTPGITGYRLRVRTPGSQEQEDVEVAKSDFQKCTAEIHAAGREITLIEPGNGPLFIIGPILRGRNGLPDFPTMLLIGIGLICLAACGGRKKFKR